jgi:hypothetical protein
MIFGGFQRITTLGSETHWSSNKKCGAQGKQVLAPALLAATWGRYSLNGSTPKLEDYLLI